MRLILATHNEGKLSELRSILSQRLGKAAESLEIVTAGSLNLADPVENGTSFEENALLKARFVAKETGDSAVADDSGLIVDFLGNAPGILSARWSGIHGDDEANNRLLLAQLADIPDNKRAARFVCCAALVVPDSSGNYKETVRYGEMRGTILRQGRGNNGFGYDPLFVPTEQPKAATDAELLTSAQMSADQKNKISHRGKAFRVLAEDIAALA